MNSEKLPSTGPDRILKNRQCFRLEYGSKNDKPRFHGVQGIFVTGLRQGEGLALTNHQPLPDTLNHVAMQIIVDLLDAFPDQILIQSDRQRFVGFEGVQKFSTFFRHSRLIESQS